MDVPGWLRIVEAIGVGIVSPLAFVVGGFFVWFKFIRQGEHQKRLQANVSIEVSEKYGRLFLKIATTVENVGNVNTPIDECYSYLILSVRELDDKTWYDLGSFREVFTEESNIEPGVTLTDESWHEVRDDGFVALKADVVVAESSELGWGARSVVSLLDVSGKITEPDTEGES